MGSVKLNVNGRTTAIIKMSLPVMFSLRSSPSDFRLLLPVSLRSRRERRYRMLDEEVSGRKKHSRIKQAPESHVSSQMATCTSR